MSAAKDQVDVAQRQLWDISAKDSVRIAEVSVLTEYRGFLESNMPKIIVGLESKEYPPEWKRPEWNIGNVGDSGYPLHDSGRDFILYSTGDNEHDRLFFTIRGMVMNVGDVAARIVADEPKFIEGESPLVSGNISLPQHLGEERGYLLRSGETALFEWIASRSVRQWVELYKDSHRGNFDDLPNNWKPSIDRPKGSFFVYPAGSALDATMRISIDMDENVVWPDFYLSDNSKQGEVWFTHQRGRIHIYVNHEYVRLPKGLDDLRKLLKPVNFLGQVED